MSAFLRALIGTTQVKGGYYDARRAGQAIAGFIARLEGRPYPLPPLDAAESGRAARRANRRGPSSSPGVERIGLALARAYAMPGMRLCLIGGAPTMLDRPPPNCRRRGALVETFCRPTTATRRHSRLF